MGNTKFVQFHGVYRGLGFEVVKPDAGEQVRQEIKVGTRADDTAIHVRTLYKHEGDWDTDAGRLLYWISGCLESNSMFCPVAWLAENVLWEGTIVRADLDWSDVRIYEVERGVLGQPVVYDPQPAPARPAKTPEELERERRDSWACAAVRVGSPIAACDLPWAGRCQNKLPTHVQAGMVEACLCACHFAGKNQLVLQGPVMPKAIVAAWSAGTEAGEVEYQAWLSEQAGILGLPWGQSEESA